MAVLLIVDDAVENIRMLKALLQDMGQIVFSLGGDDALKQAEHHRPDIILLDVVMPGIDGHETCRRLKAQPGTRDIPVVFVTGAGGEDERARGIAAGAVDYVTKPFVAEQVRACVAGQLARRPARAP